MIEDVFGDRQFLIADNVYRDGLNIYRSTSDYPRICLLRAQVQERYFGHWEISTKHFAVIRGDEYIVRLREMGLHVPYFRSSNYTLAYQVSEGLFETVLDDTAMFYLRILASE